MVESQGQNSNMTFDGSDNDMEEEFREMEDLYACMAKMNKALTYIDKYDCVLVAFSGKK